VRFFAALAIALALTAPALAQVAPRTNYAELQKTAAADPAIRKAFGAQGRSVEAQLRDDSRATALILSQTGAKPGMRVLDIGSGGGYLATLLATMVGDTGPNAGHVDIHNTPGWINQFPSMDPAVQKARIKRANIGYVTTRWNDIPREPAAAYDIIIMGQVFHDVGVEGESYDVLAHTIYDLLKPGGRLVIEDHDAIASMAPAQQVNLHRISHELTQEMIESAGLKLSDLILIDSKYDDRRFNVFRPGVRGRTDRFIATFVKPG
jgi:predicted methyltransferase